MGVLNETPDSFSDGGKYYNKQRAIARAVEMVVQGADIIDVGGESTRPGACDITEEEMEEMVLKISEMEHKMGKIQQVQKQLQEVHHAGNGTTTMTKSKFAGGRNHTPAATAATPIPITGVIGNPRMWLWAGVPPHIVQTNFLLQIPKTFPLGQTKFGVLVAAKIVILDGERLLSVRSLGTPAFAQMSPIISFVWGSP